MAKFIGNPVTAIVVALGLAGTAAAGLLDNNRQLALALWSLAALAGAVAVLEWLLRRRRSNATVAADRFVARSDQTMDLVVTIVEERFFPFQYKALIVEIKVLIYNRSGRPINLDGLAFTGADPNDSDVSGDLEVQREVWRIQAPRQRIAGLLDNEETVVGYVVHAFPHMPEGGRPGYEIYVEDVTKDRFGVAVPRREPRDFMRVPVSPAPAIVEVLYEPREPYLLPRSEGTVDHRVFIRNGDERPLRVRLELVGISPTPRNPNHSPDPDVPSAVRMTAGGDPALGIILQPGSKESWETLTTSRAVDGALSVSGFGLIRGQFPPQWPMARDERWRLKYSVVADNADVSSFALLLHGTSDGVLCELETRT